VSVRTRAGTTVAGLTTVSPNPNRTQSPRKTRKLRLDVLSTMLPNPRVTVLLVAGGSAPVRL
jgi:hypothetical protein